jgi:radical SAM protein with 4Fe4S-binding SPASM domain
MIVRFESWGAWVKLEQRPAVVAIDRAGARSLGLDGLDAWLDGAPPTPPIEVHMAVTSRCGAGCEGCYLDARPDGVEPPKEEMLARLDALQEAGVFTVAFGGGEPTTRDDIAILAEAARARGLTPVLTTSGIGLSAAKLDKLRAFAQVNVSYDGVGNAYAKVRGFEGADAAEAAIAALARAGVRVGVNIVLTRATFDDLAATVARARALGAVEAQLLRYKPAGRAASLDYLAKRLTPDQAASLGKVVRALSYEHARVDTGENSFSLRIDCALVPFLSADPELAAAPEKLARFGVFGCEAGEALCAVTVDGAVAPCSFAPSTALRAEHLAQGHHADPDLARWRAHKGTPPEPCASCTLRAVCKGGCKVVSAFVDHAHGPDPECPRVRMHRATSGDPAGEATGATA